MSIPFSWKFKIILVRNNSMMIYKSTAQTAEARQRIYDQINEVCKEHDSIIPGGFKISVSKWGTLPFPGSPAMDYTWNCSKSTRAVNTLYLNIITKEDFVSNVPGWRKVWYNRSQTNYIYGNFQ